MKKLILALLFTSTAAIAQTNVEVYNDSYSQYYFKNLDSKLTDFNVPVLGNEEEKTLRIWRENELFVLGNKSSYYVSSYKDKLTGFVYKFKYKLDKISLQDITIDNLKELENYYDIESKPIMVELFDDHKYFTRVFSINAVINQKISSLLRSDLIVKKDLFEKQLPGGTYQVGSKILTIEVDKAKLPKVANINPTEEIN